MQTWRWAAGALKREIGALVLAYRDPRTPWYARIGTLGVVASALIYRRSERSRGTSFAALGA